MSIGGGILSASLLALFTFAACTAVPLVLKTLIGERLCSFVPVTNARRDFSRIMLAALAIHILQPFSEWCFIGFSPLISAAICLNYGRLPGQSTTPMSLIILILPKLVCKRWERSPSDRFYPMLPLLMRMLNPVFHNSFVSAQIINTIATCLASGMAYLTLYGILGKSVPCIPHCFRFSFRVQFFLIHQ